jgi:hypothetical protein
MISDYTTQQLSSLRIALHEYVDAYRDISNRIGAIGLENLGRRRNFAADIGTEP